MASDLERLDEIPREAWAGNYERVGVLSTGTLVRRAWMTHMLQVWRGSSQPKN